VCLDRYHFTVGLAACLISGRVSLLPSTYTPEVVRQLAQFAPDAFCLTDESDCSVELPRIDVSKIAPARDSIWPAPQLGLGAGRAYAGRAYAGRAYAGRAYTLVGTVPAQHMYGFESTVLLAL